MVVRDLGPMDIDCDYSSSTVSTQTRRPKRASYVPAAPPTNPSPEPIRYARSSKFYYADLIEVRVLSGRHAGYLVPATLLQSSNLPHSSPNKNATTENSDGSLILEGVSPAQMEAFLDVADTRVIARNKTFSFEQWAGALCVANRFNLTNLRTFIIPAMEEGLDRLDPFECVEAAELYKVQNWLLRPLCRICKRADSLSPSEMGRLGLDRTSAVARVREKLLTRTALFTEANNPPSPLNPQEVVRNEVLRLIEEEPLLTQLLPSGSPTQPIRPAETRPAFPARFTLSDFISIKVQSCLYSLPITYFQSPELPRVLQKQGNEDFVVLPFDFSQSDWEIFLQIITARPYDELPLSLSFPEWVRGLHVAKLMEHHDASNYIRTKIQTHFLDEDPVELLGVAIQLEFPESEWLQGRFDALADRKQNISAEEILRLGAKATETVCRLREERAYIRGRASVPRKGGKRL